MATGISYVDETWNPVRGCSPVSPGCLNCYAKGIAHRFRWGLTTDAGEWSGEVELVEKALSKPAKMPAGSTVLVPSMGDLFDIRVPASWVERVFGIMRSHPFHTFLVLTKRIHHARILMTGSPPFLNPVRNVIVGATIEDRKRADERLPELARIAGAGWRVWISAEPLLGPFQIDLPIGLWRGRRPSFVAIGGETGPRARPCATDWIRMLVGDCLDLHLRCHVKQLGKGTPFDPVEWPRQRVRHL